MSAINRKIYKLVIPYLPQLNKWSKSTYDDGKGNVTIDSLKRDLDKYKKFIEEDMPQNLKVKLIYSNVTLREYEEFNRAKEALIEHINSTLVDIDDIKEMNDLSDKKASNYKLLTDGISEKEIST